MAVVKPLSFFSGLILFVVLAFGAGASPDFQTEFTSLLKWEPLSLVESHADASWVQKRVSPVVLAEVSELVPKNELFANRKKHHMKAVNLVKDIFMAQDTVEDVLRISLALKDDPQINSKLWIHAFISAKLSRADMQGLKLPPLVEIMPDDFIPREIFSQASGRDKNENECLILDDGFTEDNGAENALWYFREDLLVNSHHWFWHIYYLVTGFPDSTNHADRRGELFYFMHHEILARYAAERMTSGLPRINPLNYDSETPLQHYYSHLTDVNSGFNWTDRTPDTKLSDVNIAIGPGNWFNISIDSTKNVQELIRQDLNSGYLIDVNGTMIPLDGFSGIDLLADTVEASIWSVDNPPRYSTTGEGFNGFHDTGHVLLAFVSNPIQLDPSQRPAAGPMLATSISLRDPIFYRHHTAVENIFQEHKNTLSPHTPTDSEFPLISNEVGIFDFVVDAETGDLPANNLQTYWNYKEYNFSRGLDMTRNTSFEPITICAKHLDHVEFDYTLDMIAASSGLNVTVRIYMARRFDQNMNRFSMKEQHTMFFALDQFPLTLRAGVNRIKRNSKESTLTIPFDAWLGLEESDTIFQNCGCGWPHHMLLPMGSAVGTTFDLFAMVTQETVEIRHDEGCRVAPLWCGLRGQKYPTRYPMGYPFDRKPYSVTNGGSERVVADLEEYVNGIPNMMAIQVTITHLEEARK